MNHHPEEQIKLGHTSEQTPVSDTSRTTISAFPPQKAVSTKLAGQSTSAMQGASNQATAGSKKQSKIKSGRWTRDEHFRFLEALKLYGKEWKHVQLHVESRSSTQARSHAQKFFVKLQKKNKTLEEFLEHLDLKDIQRSLAEQDVSDSGAEEESCSTSLAGGAASAQKQRQSVKRAVSMKSNDVVASQAQVEKDQVNSMSITTSNDGDANKLTQEAKNFVSFSISKVGPNSTNAGGETLVKIPESAEEEIFANQSDCAIYEASPEHHLTKLVGIQEEFLDDADENQFNFPESQKGPQIAIINGNSINSQRSDSPSKAQRAQQLTVQPLQIDNQERQSVCHVSKSEILSQSRKMSTVGLKRQSSQSSRQLEQSILQAGSLKRQKTSSNNFENLPISSLFSNPKGYAPLEDRPETHLASTEKNLMKVKKRKSIGNLSAKVSESNESKPQQSEGYKGGFVRPISLNPAAMHTVDQTFTNIYTNVPQTTKPSALYYSIKNGNENEFGLQSNQAQDSQSNQHHLYFKVQNAGYVTPNTRKVSNADHLLEGLVPAQNEFAEPVRPGQVESTSQLAQDAQSSHAQEEQFQIPMPIQSFTPRLKASANKSPILMPIIDGTKRANSLFDQDMAFMSNPDFALQPGFGANDFDNLDGLNPPDLGVVNAEDYQRMDGGNHLLGLANEEVPMIDNFQNPILVTRGRSQTFHLNNQITTARNPLFTASNALCARGDLLQINNNGGLRGRLGTAIHPMLPRDRQARNSFDFDERDLDLTAQGFLKMQQMEENRYGLYGINDFNLGGDRLDM